MADRSRGPTPGATPEHSGAHQNHLGVPPMGRDSMFKFGGDSDRRTRTVTPASQAQGPSPVTRAARDGRGHGVTDLTTGMTLAIQLSQAVLTISTNRGVPALSSCRLD